ncbi:hypothetical protein [Haloquadratum walsbyi]|uniref:hypothetical protein n=1 Tax=Haloquadratum walsbyi TaxID=293091 RepID=UPI000324230B|nr:hypothetical protein [Haloquadratum walsbyi]
MAHAPRQMRGSRRGYNSAHVILSKSLLDHRRAGTLNRRQVSRPRRGRDAAAPARPVRDAPRAHQ